MKNALNLIILLVASLALAAKQVFTTPSGIYSRRDHGLELLANTTCPEGRTTRYAEAAVTASGLIGRPGTAANQANICNANQAPFCVFRDTAPANDTVPICLLGVTPGTIVVIGSEVIARGAEVFVAANGQCQDLPVSAGTYYSIGYAYTACAGAGQEFEIIHHTPRVRVV